MPERAGAVAPFDLEMADCPLAVDPPHCSWIAIPRPVRGGGWAIRQALVTGSIEPARNGRGDWLGGASAWVPLARPRTPRARLAISDQHAHAPTAATSATSASIAP